MSGGGIMAIIQMKIAGCPQQWTVGLTNDPEATRTAIRENDLTNSDLDWQHWLVRSTKDADQILNTCLTLGVHQSVNPIDRNRPIFVFIY